MPSSLSTSQWDDDDDEEEEEDGLLPETNVSSFHILAAQLQPHKSQACPSSTTTEEPRFSPQPIRREDSALFTGHPSPANAL